MHPKDTAGEANITTTSCIALAGGKSTRFGRDKKTEIIAGQSLLERVLRRLKPLAQEIIVVTAQGQSIGPLPLDNVKVVSDVLPGKGPLGGIYTGLLESRSECNIVVASDMPFLNQNLLTHMAQSCPCYDMVVPRVGNLVEPLHAIYARSCISVIEELLRNNNLVTYALMDLVKVRYIDKEEIERFDPEHLSFFNINTKSDLARALELAERGK